MNVAEVTQWLSTATQEEREEVFRHLRPFVPLHALERTLNTTAEVVLGAIERAGGLTLRMIRGVIAEAAFDVEVARGLTGWQNSPVIGNPSFDAQLSDPQGPVRVQVKLQRSKGGQPMAAEQAVKGWSAQLFVTETQKTRSGTKRTAKKAKAPAQKTRPYSFGEFDILAVSMYPSAGRWDRFMYTVGDWLVPDPADGRLLHKFQPVAATMNGDWTDDFLTVVSWLRSGARKTIRTA